ncbi:integrase catalytic domain-containing protein [Trichonephila inaurata madagascariensis]|uniref:Integrase catalytic domain-containing protein n=1 Tax=Trichonephila inaurata madagascariensis TaxID=2747483 RepID=A0A8X6XGA4_9ARAC|nr:integrase catalytic domain-containing protein [Trichonephila inaurata madagascariensis]
MEIKPSYCLLVKCLGEAVDSSQCACLSYEDMITVLYDCESIINSRPFTYTSENDSEFVPLSPSLFLQDIKEIGVPDCDTVDHKSLNKRVKYRLERQKDIWKKLRLEYLGSLIQRPKHLKSSSVSVGDVILIGNDNQKRTNWTLRRVT